MPLLTSKNSVNKRKCKAIKRNKIIQEQDKVVLAFPNLLRVIRNIVKDHKNYINIAQY